MSRYQGLKFKNLLTVFLICGAFLFVSQANALNNYAKEYNGTLTAAEWNGLFSDFVNTMLPVRMNGPLGINTAAPTNPIFLDVNGTVQASAFLGPITGTISAANVSSGAFGGNTGGGNYSFPGNVGIGTINPQVPLSVVSSGDNWGLFIGPNAGSTTGQRLKLGYFGTSNYSAIQSIQDGTAATNLILQKDGGNVGIGMTNPGANLHVQGAAANYISKFQSTADDNFNQFISATGIGEYGIWGDSLYFQALDNLANGIRFYGGSSSRVDLQIINSGNVGIGATNPEAKLHISGGALMLESGSASFITGFGKSLIYSSSGGGSYPFDRWGNLIIQPRTTLASDIVFAAGTTPSVRMVIKDSGSVGIGTTTPATTLDVNGLIKMRTSTILSSEDVVNKGYLDSALASTTSGIITQVATSSFWQGSLTGGIYNANTGNVGIGTTNPAQKLQVASDGVYSQSQSGQVYISGATTPGKRLMLGYDTTSNFAFLEGVNFGTGYSPIILNPFQGNVGIGTTNPGRKLSVVMDGTYANSGSGSLELAGATTGTEKLVLGYDTTNLFGYIFATQQGNFYRNLVLNPSGGNVGIGTTDPQGKLMIVSDANGTDNHGISVRGSDYPTNLGYISINKQSGTNSYGSIQVGDQLNYQSLAINPNGGNVGIGTIAPNDKLSIGLGGNAAPAGSDSTGHNYANTYLSTDDYALANYGLVKTLIAGGSGSSVGYWTMSGANIYNSNAGNVGIGTTAPGTRLEVLAVAPDANRTVPQNILTITSQQNNAPYSGFGGGILFKDQMYTLGINNSARIRTSINYDGYVGQEYGGSLAFDVTPTVGGALTEAMRIKYNGYVGIGRTNPTTALDVNGTVTATSFSGPLAGTISSQNVSAGEFGKNTGGGNFIFGATVPGNVGIGTTNPTLGRLQITQNSDTVNGGLAIANASVGTALYLWADANSTLNHIYSGGGGTDNLEIKAGSVGIGTTDPGAYRLKVVGDVAITGALLTQTGSDFAEEFKAPHALEPGTVVVMGDEGYKSVKSCVKGYDKTVVGIVSDNPSIIAGRTDIDNKNPEKVIVAMMGVVSVNVSDINGSIEKGDLLVSSGISGYAMKSAVNRPGTVIGKALENLTGKTGKIKVLVNLQ